jgi:hypothetical protein
LSAELPVAGGRLDGGQSSLSIVALSVTMLLPATAVATCPRRATVCEAVVVKVVLPVVLLPLGLVVENWELPFTVIDAAQVATPAAPKLRTVNSASTLKRKAAAAAVGWVMRMAVKSVPPTARSP